MTLEVVLFTIWGFTAGCYLAGSVLWGWYRRRYRAALERRYIEGWDACAKVARWNSLAVAELPTGRATRRGAFFSDN